MVVLAILGGVVSADFWGGFVHWAADSWGSIDLPVVGKVGKFCYLSNRIDIYVLYIWIYILSIDICDCGHYTYNCYFNDIYRVIKKKVPLLIF